MLNKLHYRTTPIMPYPSTGATVITCCRNILNEEPIGDLIIIESAGGANTGNVFRYDFDNEQYIFNLNTKSLSQGLWQLQVYLDDGTVKMGFINLK